MNRGAINIDNFEIFLVASFMHTPLPLWRDLIKSVYRRTASDEELAMPWVRPGELSFWFSRSAWSLLVIAKWRQRSTAKQVVYIWVPEFFCNLTLSPLREMGAKLVFYPVTQRMEPDLPACRRLGMKQSLDLFILVHYFGNPSSAEDVAIFCRENGAWLIEDATHVFTPIPLVGESADCVLYSPHKHLPIPDGAVLILRPNGPGQLGRRAADMKKFADALSCVLSLPGKSSWPSVLWLLKRLAQLCGVKASSGFSVFKAEALISSQSETVSGHPEMTTLAKRLLFPQLSRLQVIQLQRKKNANLWSRVLCFIDPGEAGINNEMKSTPYLASFSGKNPSITEVLFNQLQQLGLPITTWPDLPPEILHDTIAHPVAITLRHSFFYLPLHQSIKERQILSSGKNLANKVTAKWQVRPISREEWEIFWKLCSQTNLLQSWQYGDAKQRAEGWKPCRLLISDENSVPVALIQTLTKGLPLLGYFVRINRGPQLLNNFSEAKKSVMSVLAINALLGHAKNMKWRIIQIAPELSEVGHNTTAMSALGFHRVPGDPWGSGRLKLENSENDLLFNLKRNWKRALRKAESQAIEVRINKFSQENLALLMQNYASLQLKNNFSGLTNKLIKALSEQHGSLWEFNIFVAVATNMPDFSYNQHLGVLLTIRSGDTTTAIVVTTTDEGRRMQVTPLLYWKSIIHAKRQGCLWFDIGGLNEATPKSIAEFKKGLGAETYTLSGEWRKWIF